ncbi:MAG TPA: methyltransferase [Acidimicrobiales bacterium]|jgi:hypothetical protein|nr:methyltransferase [Acidimicrobiales bacterium]
MSSTMATTEPNGLPHEIVWTITNDGIRARCLQLAAEVGVADLIDDDPVSVEELAAACDAQADALHRIMRLLASNGIFDRDGRSYRHTPASRLLRNDHPMSMRAFSRMMGLPLFPQVWSNLDHSLRTGKPSVEVSEPRGFWAYLQDHPDEAQVFGQAMAAKASADIAAVVAAYDFRGIASFADVGGGHGHLLRALLDHAPAARGVLFDLPEVIGGLGASPDRIDYVAGDFFADPLPAAEAYLLMDVLHDWDDARAAQILTAIRSAAPETARLLVIEDVLPGEEHDARAHTLDVIMLAVTGGRERTPQEFEALFARCGFRTAQVFSTDGPRRIIEARRLA